MTRKMTRTQLEMPEKPDNNRYHDKRVRELLRKMLKTTLEESLEESILTRGDAKFGFKDRGTFICEELTVEHGIPHVLRRNIKSRSGKIETNFPVDIRDVLYEMDPLHLAHATEETSFNKDKTLRNFEDIMDFQDEQERRLTLLSQNPNGYISSRHEDRNQEEDERPWTLVMSKRQQRSTSRTPRNSQDSSMEILSRESNSSIPPHRQDQVTRRSPLGQAATSPTRLNMDQEDIQIVARNQPSPFQLEEAEEIYPPDNYQEDTPIIDIP